MPQTKENDKQETVQETKESGHDRLDRITANLGYTAQDEAIRELAEFVRETTPDSKLGKRSADEESDT